MKYVRKGILGNEDYMDDATYIVCSIDDLAQLWECSNTTVRKIIKTIDKIDPGLGIWIRPIDDGRYYVNVEKLLHWVSSKGALQIIGTKVTQAMTP